MGDSKIKKSVLSFPVMFQKTEEFENSDCRFTKVKIWLMHLGQNYNGSVFEKSVVDSALPTLGYIPIVAFIENNRSGEQDCSDHRYIIVKDEKGVHREYQGVAYGVILSNEDNNAHYEERLCDDGETRTFLVVDGLIWNMFEDSSDIINRDLIKSQSMELWDDGSSVEGYEDENRIFHFTKFSFRAACILGKDYEPAMINSTVEVQEVQFTINNFVKNIQTEINNKYCEFTRLVNKNKNNESTKDVDNQNNKGGITTMTNTDFAQTVMEHFEDIGSIVSQHETVVNRWGDRVPRYSLKDIQENEAIVVDRNNNYRIYGFPFTMNGDKPNIDFSSAKRKKTQYVDYDETASSTENGFDFGKHIADIENSAFDKVTDAQNKVSEFEKKVEDIEKAKAEVETNYSTVKAELDDLKPKYDEFVKAEQARLDAELDEKKNAEFAKYETVFADCAEFETLKEKKSEMTLDKIESECAILYARKNLGKTNFSKFGNSSLSAGIIDDSKDDEGYVATKYGNIPVSKR